MCLCLDTRELLSVKCLVYVKSARIQEFVGLGLFRRKV